jgi:hypothetical protein
MSLEARGHYRAPHVQSEEHAHAMTDDDDRLDRALRTLTAARLVALGIPAPMVGGWCDAWELEAERRGLDAGAASWEDGIRWIMGRVAANEGPPD